MTVHMQTTKSDLQNFVLFVIRFMGLIATVYFIFLWLISEEENG